MKVKHSILPTVALLLGFGVIQPAWAEVIYSFTDDHGVVHFTNVPTDERYVPFIGSSANYPGKSRATSNNGHLIASLKRQYGPIIKEVARAHALEDALLHAVVTVESAYNPRAVSKK